jgi:uncharacterized membrane protein YcaP (DUF421 family)
MRVGSAKTEPFLLFYHGNFLQDSLRKHRITEDEILQIIRSNGNSNLQDVDAVVLETNGKFSVIKKSKSEGKSSLNNVVGPIHSSEGQTDKQ